MSEQLPLSIEGLECRYGQTPVFAELSLQLEAGELVAVLGSSGSGKSTLLRAVAGFVNPTSGSIKVFGQTVVDGGRERVAAEARCVGMVFQDYALFPHMTVEKNVAFGIDAWPSAKRRERVEALLELTGLAALGQRRPAQLSGGQQQRVALARALAPHPKVLLLDEPFANLDASLRHGLSESILDILRQEGVSAMLVTHDRGEALGMADRVAVLGRVTGESRARLRQLDTPEAIYRRPVDAHVAELTGEAIFLEGQGLGLQAQTPLGVLPLERAAEGAVELMLRPEQLRFEPQSDGPAAVLKRRFLGARTHLRVETPAGVLPVDCEEGAKVGARGVIKVEGGAWPLPR